MRFLSERDAKIAAAQAALKAANDELYIKIQSGDKLDITQLSDAHTELYDAMQIETLYECFACGKEFNPISKDGSSMNCLVLGVTTVVFQDGSRTDYDPADTRHITFCNECTDMTKLLDYLKRR